MCYNDDKKGMDDKSLSCGIGLEFRSIECVLNVLTNAGKRSYCE
jgi:hypothetical protein